MKKIGLAGLKQDIKSGKLKSYSAYDFGACDPLYEENILHFCAEEVSVPQKIIKWLCRGGVELDKTNFKGMTPIHKALENNNDVALGALLGSRADPNILYSNNCSFAAAFHKKKEVVMFKLLWQYGTILPEKELIFVPEALSYIKISREICSNSQIHLLTTPGFDGFIGKITGSSRIVHSDEEKKSILDYSDKLKKLIINDITSRFLNILVINSCAKKTDLKEYLLEVEIKIDHYFPQDFEISKQLKQITAMVAKRLLNQPEDLSISKTAEVKEDVQAAEDAKYNLTEKASDNKGKGLEISIAGSDSEMEETMYFSIVEQNDFATES